MTEVKKWATQLAGEGIVEHSTQGAAYNHLHGAAASANPGEVGKVLVDEGLGFGWRVHDLLDLETMEHPAGVVCDVCGTAVAGKGAEIDDEDNH